MGRSPGIDGLTAEFYKHFWGIIGEDFYEVVLESFKMKYFLLVVGGLYFRCYKKGRFRIFKKLEARVFIMLDYKILSKSIANRLKTCLNMLIHKDQHIVYKAVNNG